MKGIILAGGWGTRCYPMTKAVSKHLLPVYDKPMIYYPLCTLMEAGISDILVITSPEFLTSYRNLLGDGSQWGIRLTYLEQKAPQGVAQAFVIGENFIANDNVCLILGDNLFYGASFAEKLKNAVQNHQNASVFAYSVPNPADFGVLTLDMHGNVTAITEKPDIPASAYAVAGIYLYDASVCEIAKNLCPSARGELEITDINRHYLQNQKLTVYFEDSVWMDMGTPENLFEAASFIFRLQKEKMQTVFCPEKIAFQNGWITKNQLFALGKAMQSTAYGQNILYLGESL